MKSRKRYNLEALKKKWSKERVRVRLEEKVELKWIETVDKYTKVKIKGDDVLRI